MKNKAFDNLKVNPKFRNFKKRGTCFVLAGLMTASLCGQARAMEQTLSEGQTISLMSAVTPSILTHVTRNVQYGVNIFANDTSFTPVNVNGVEVNPFIDDLTGTTYVPIRALSNLLNAKIEWDSVNRAVLIDTTAGINLVNNTPSRVSTPLTPGKFSGVEGVQIYINGVLFIPTNVNGVPVKVFVSDDGTTFVPLRAVSNAFGVDIAWEGKTNSAYVGKHVVIEDPMEGYLLPGQTGYVYPDENGSVVSLEARYMQIYNLLKKVNALVDEKQITISKTSDEALTYYQEYSKCYDSGNTWVVKYAEQTDEVGRELQLIIDSMEPEKQEALAWIKYGDFASYIQNKPGSYPKNTICAGITAVEESTRISLDRLNTSFDSNDVKYFEDKFTAIYNSFLQEKALHACISAYTLKP